MAEPRPVRRDSIRVAAPQVPRVLVIALDGATYDVLTPLAHEGLMPNLAHFLSGAALAELHSTEPAVTPTAWSTFQTGCDPGAHGIFDYRFLDTARRRLMLNHARRIRRPTIFDLTSAADFENVSLNLPMTYPPREGLRGITVGGLDSPSADAAMASAGHLARRLKAQGTRYTLGTIWRRKPRSYDELRSGIDRTREAFRSRAAAALLADEMTDWRLMVVQFQTLDSLQHRLWHLLGISESGGGHRRWIECARDAFSALDECIGELCTLAGRRGATVLVASDHGFGAFREKIFVPELLKRRKLLIECHGPRRALYRAARIGWKLRRSLMHRRNRGRSTAALMRPPQALLPIDWRRSAAVTLHGALGALVYLNTPERFGPGPIVGQRLYEQAAAEVVGALREARHPETDDPLFESAYSTQSRYGGDPLENEWPDVVGIPAPGFHTSSRIDRNGELTRPDPDMLGTHRPEGVLMVGAPAVVQGAPRRANLRDVAPTILELLGISHDARMDGRILSELFAQPAELYDRALVPPKRRSAVTPNYVADGRPMRTETDLRVPPADQREVEKRLAELGYLE